MTEDTKRDERNRGALFKNGKKNGDHDPTATGSLDVDGVAYWVSAWTNTSRKTGDKFWALSVRRKDLPNDRPPKQKSQSESDAQADAVFGID